MKVPILRLRDILLTSIPVDLADDDALQFQAHALETLKTTEAKGMVMDITGLDVVDSFMARVINDTATMARMLGTEVVVCGMRPEVALALVEMGRELIGVETALNLDQGVEKVRRLISAREGSRE